MFTSSGMMSPRMFEIIKGAENIEKQFGEYAIDLVARLEGNLKKAAQEVNTGSWLRSVATNERQKAKEKGEISEKNKD